MAVSSMVETYDLRVEISDSDPAIWRQVCVQSNLPLAALHRVLAATIGWSGQAAYRFKAQGQVLAEGAAGGLETGPQGPALSTLLTQPHDALLYIYAPAQGWLHKVTLESIGSTSFTAGPLPCCTAGERQCPPEFCNGVWDYVDLLDRLGDSDDPDEVDALWQRVGYDFDPEYFDLAAANSRLQALAGDALAQIVGE
ncbi:MAG: plasmid pRiA4b ORF-3 family protein [Leptolyngbya sp. DLM2.Bin27]|nr:MAG: plasmid pRiA4b ORF-3 family protein [Leptolyngbya sp. DLM2.Bin27]